MNIACRCDDCREEMVERITRVLDGAAMGGLDAYRNDRDDGLDGLARAVVNDLFAVPHSRTPAASPSSGRSGAARDEAER